MKLKAVRTFDREEGTQILIECEDSQGMMYEWADFLPIGKPIEELKNHIDNAIATFKYQEEHDRL